MLCTKHDNLPEQRDLRGAFITTNSGVRFFVDECNIKDVPIQDIAHALSQNCRFNGHLADFYSVAEHSVIVSYLVPSRYAMTALLHDVSEAFVPDMPRPFKPLITGFEEYEDRIQEAVAACYGTVYPLPEEVKYIDKNIVRDEAEAFYPDPPDWIEFYESVAAPLFFNAWSPKVAKAEFLDRFYYLRNRDKDDG